MFSKVSKAIYRRLTILFLVFAFCCAMLYGLIWLFSPVDDLSANVGLTLLITIWLVLEFCASPRPWQNRGELLWFTIFLGLALLLTASEKYNWNDLAINAVVALIALPFWWFVWRLVRGSWLLFIGFALAMVVAMIYWIAAWIKSLVMTEILLLPIPVVILGGVIWTPIAWKILDIAKRRKNRKVSGPGMQALAMGTLFLPVLLVVVSVPGILELKEIWFTVSLTLLGVLLSAVVSTPLRNFLLELGKLSPNTDEIPEQPMDVPLREE